MDESSIRKSESLRPAAVAGQFYPAEANKLRRTVENFLSGVEPGKPPTPKAMIGPHAGYAFCGPLAAAAYARLAPARDEIKRVVLVGPSHFVPFSGVVTATKKYAGKES